MKSGDFSICGEPESPLLRNERVARRVVGKTVTTYVVNSAQAVSDEGKVVA